MPREVRGNNEGQGEGSRHSPGERERVRCCRGFSFDVRFVSTRKGVGSGREQRDSLGLDRTSQQFFLSTVAKRDVTGAGGLLGQLVASLREGFMNWTGSSRRRNRVGEGVVRTTSARSSLVAVLRSIQCASCEKDGASGLEIKNRRGTIRTIPNWGCAKKERKVRTKRKKKKNKISEKKRKEKQKRQSWIQGLRMETTNLGRSWRQLRLTKREVPSKSLLSGICVILGCNSTAAVLCTVRFVLRSGAWDFARTRNSKWTGALGLATSWPAVPASGNGHEK